MKLVVQYTRIINDKTSKNLTLFYGFGTIIFELLCYIFTQYNMRNI